jgi:hypothetical protein
VAYHLVQRLEDGRRSVASFETRREAEAHRDALIAKDPGRANALVVLGDLDDQDDQEVAPED